MINRFAGQGFNLFNPFTYGNVGKAIEKTRSGDPTAEYTDSPVGTTAERANRTNQLIRMMNEGRL